MGRGLEVKAPLLTGRMAQVTVLVGRDGLSYKAVALRLDISLHTVRTYAWRVRDVLEPGSDRPRHLMAAYYWKHRKAMEEVQC